MGTQPAITEILPRIESAIQRLVQLVTPLSPTQATQPLLAEGRSVKDMLAHLTWWDQWLLITLPPARNTSALAITLPLADQIPKTEHWADEMNVKIDAYNNSRTFAVIWADFTTTRDQLLHRVAQISDDDLLNVDSIESMIGQPVAPLIRGIYEHYEEHAHELERLSA